MLALGMVRPKRYRLIHKLYEESCAAILGIVARHPVFMVVSGGIVTWYIMAFINPFADYAGTKNYGDYRAKQHEF